MRILFVNKFGFVRGGQERVVFDEITWLRERGHEAELFATAHADNLPWRYPDRFPPYREIGVGGSPSLAAVAEMFWNARSLAALDAVIADYRPDVVHFHGIHRHLSPSVLEAARRHSVPTVMTLHDYWPLCPGNVLLRGGREVCDPRRCSATFWPAVANRCVQGSFARSALAATELSWQRLTRSYESRIDALVSPSAFLKSVVEAGGFHAREFAVIPNAVEPTDAAEFDGSSRRFLYAGRLSAEKGLDVLLDACADAGAEIVGAGGGPMRPEVENLPFVEYRGMLDAQGLRRAREETIAAVVPSSWYENAPLAIMESMACGRPVIGSDIGGIPELVRDGLDGLLVTPGDASELASAMTTLALDAQKANAMGIAARQRVAESFSPEAHVSRLMALYEGLSA